MNAFKLSKIVDQPVRFVNADAEGNTYAVIFNDAYNFQLLKLNPTNGISSIVNITYGVADALVSSRGDSYLDLRLPDKSSHTLGIIRANSTEIETIDEMDEGLFHIDNNDNFFYEKKNVVHLLRSKSSVPAPVKILDGFDVNINPVTDKSGNMYIRLFNLNKTNDEADDTYYYALALITKEALKDEIPQVTFIDGLSSVQEVKYCIPDEENNLWFAVSEEATKENSIKRLAKGNLKTIQISNSQKHKPLISSKGKTYYAAEDQNGTRIFYITANDEIVEIPDLKNLTMSIYWLEGLVDSKGQIYFYGLYGNLSSSFGMMVTIKPDETKPIPIKLDGSSEMSSILLDFNDDLWFFTKDIYHLKKGETVPELGSDSKEIHCLRHSRIYINRITKNIYASCDDKGLFMIENI